MMSQRKQLILDFLLDFSHISWSIEEILEEMTAYHDEVSWTQGTVTRIVRELKRATLIREVPFTPEYKAVRRSR